MMIDGKGCASVLGALLLGAFALYAIGATVAGWI